MNYLDKKPFCLLDSISEKFLNILLKDIPYKFENQVKNKIQVSYEMSHNLIKDNWKKGVYMLNSNETHPTYHLSLNIWNMYLLTFQN